MFFGRTSGGVSWLVVGLGNVGEKYDNTRHNVGFEVADELAERGRAPIQKLKHRALTEYAGNRRGEGPADEAGDLYEPLRRGGGGGGRFFKVPADRVLVISDDVSLPVGKLRVRRGGSAGGHNGLKNIIQHLGSDQFPRIKVGVGEKPHPDYDMADWVLGKFQGEDRRTMDGAVKRAADAVECFLREGPDKTMSRFNG